MHVIKSFSKEEKVDAINILLLAFSSDPFQRYMMPDPSIYFRNSTIWFNNAIKQSILVKGVWGTENYSGVAVWFPPKHKIEFEVIQKTFKDFPSVIEKDIYQYFKEFGKNKPDEAWYLEYLGVDPNSQSLGIGSQILKNSLAKIDDLNQPAYLESSNPKNMSLYKRHGFETIKKIQFGEGPALHTMYREAR
tara:strand:- start:536 stop:1108 length:573 start_codon:yes stop_codon:yes gene_type:complete